MALIWYLTGNKKLSKTVADIFIAAKQGETRLYVSAISWAEVYYANQKWGWFDDFSALYHELEAKPYFRFAPFHADDVLDFEHDLPVPEMHDRIIIGLARRLSAPLITSDPLIIASELVPIIW